MRVMVPAGTYILGDPCYTIKNEDWDFVLESTDFFTYSDTVMPDGRFVMAFHTAYGDGTYRGSDGVAYGVDAGVIGLVQTVEGYVAEHNYVSVIVFNVDTMCIKEDGVLTFGDVIIDTDPEFDNGFDDYDVDFNWCQEDDEENED